MKGDKNTLNEEQSKEIISKYQEESIMTRNENNIKKYLSLNQVYLLKFHIFH